MRYFNKRLGDMKMSKKSIENYPIQLKHILIIGFLSWLAMIGIDFFIHAGLLAKFYTNPSPFLLSPGDAFRLIPLGYLSFGILAILLIWLMLRLNVVGWQKGLIFGLILGGLTWGSFILGLLSISTAETSLLLGWFLGQTFELGIGGAVAGKGLSGYSLKKLFVIVFIGIIILVVLTITLQSIGFAPSMRI